MNQTGCRLHWFFCCSPWTIPEGDVSTPPCFHYESGTSAIQICPSGGGACFQSDSSTSSELTGTNGPLSRQGMALVWLNVFFCFSWLERNWALMGRAAAFLYTWHERARARCWHHPSHEEAEAPTATICPSPRGLKGWQERTQAHAHTHARTHTRAH